MLKPGTHEVLSSWLRFDWRRRFTRTPNTDLNKVSTCEGRSWFFLLGLWGLKQLLQQVRINPRESSSVTTDGLLEGLLPYPPFAM